MNIGILYIATDRYIELYEDFKKTFDKYFLTRHNKKYFIITDNKEFKCCNNEEKILIEDEGWRMTNLKRFEYFLKCDLSDMDYVFFFNGNSICRDEVFDNDIIPNEDEKYLCGTWLFFHNALNPYDNNKNSACYMPCKLNYAFRGGLLGGRTQEFIKMCNSCIEMIKYDLSMNYIPKWNDEAYFNKYVENLNIKKVEINIFSYFNFKNFKSKILTRYKQNVFGKDYIMKRKSIKNYNSALLN